jgi:hypothetical protein
VLNYGVSFINSLPISVMALLEACQKEDIDQIKSLIEQKVRIEIYFLRNFSNDNLV